MTFVHYTHEHFNGRFLCKPGLAIGLLGLIIILIVNILTKQTETLHALLAKVDR